MGVFLRLRPVADTLRTGRARARAAKRLTRPNAGESYRSLTARNKVLGTSVDAAALRIIDPVTPPPPHRTLRLVILDMDGVLYRGEQPIPGATVLVQRLHGAGLAVRYATNNSMFTRETYAERLRGMGIDAVPDEIVTSTSATIEHLRRHAPDVRRVLAVGAEGMVGELAAAGYEVIPVGETTRRNGSPAVDAVLVGLDPAFDDDRLAAAAAAVRGGARLIATNADARYPTATGFRPGAGTIVAAIAEASGATPLVIGKPQPAMFTAILEAAGVDAAEALVIGDNPDADVAGAYRSGIASLLVLTGVTDAARAAALEGEGRPDHVAAGPAEAWQVVERLLAR
jgi:4-nitrophenyl phosphatase